MSAKRPILITGSHRSGTTWVGRNLALASGTNYLLEPFNPNIRFPVISSPLDGWYRHICSENAHRYQNKIDEIFDDNYPLLKNLMDVRSLKEFKYVVKSQYLAKNNKKNQGAQILKDPIALFSAEWLHQTYNTHVLVMVRHPAAFCSSLKLKNWQFSFSNFLDQPLLIESYLANFKDQIQVFANTKQDILEQAILMWNCIHGTIKAYQEKQPDWLFIRHEDLSRDPVNGFRTIFSNFGLNFSSEVEQGVRDSSGAHNPSEQDSNNEYRRNSRENITNWKTRLSAAEIDMIKQKTQTISSHFYNESDW